LFLFKVFESFVDYVAVEQLDGDNKYDAGEHGLQVTSFPSCLRFFTQARITLGCALACAFEILSP
jgi:hypothetical protein